MASATERIASKIEMIPGSSCWYWTGAIDKDGYGQLKFQQRMRRAHRLSYEAFVGPIPDGLHIDHLCRERSCVNPTHMEPVTPRENTMRSPIAPAACKARMVVCDKGHRLDWTASGQRRCLDCRRERDRVSQRARRRAKRGEMFGKWTRRTELRKKVNCG